ncbi:FliM/FliN family flagellar motor switch protein [Mangrovicoccus algicola]|uniref:FliM/FliN family flagellar motor switch protein n=1 Tax=Mangrovicoccus algicola TaxID=2771008 RepID=A0A8J6ZA53_9RHOB|nr:flagellar motor switch protein FliM [Mangrovicoccus algicola]MBE3639200.1 FliM/FliN family flagellar motor switch protein [Mangrovicoccus algicola]
MTLAGRAPPEFGEVSPAKALRLALAKAGQEVLQQVVTGSGLEELKLPIDKVADQLPEAALVLELSGPRGKRGLIALDRGLVFAITESLTTGHVNGGPVPDRLPTRTDALLCRRFLVMMMTVFAARLVGHPASDWATGFVPEEKIEDLRRLPVTMEDVPYRMLVMETDIALGTRLGQICILVPWDDMSLEPVAALEDHGAEDRARAWSSALEAAVMGCDIEMTAVLHRAQMTVAELRALQPGSLIRLPAGALGRAVLETADGQKVFSGRLGDLDGYRAVMVEDLPGAPSGPPESPGDPGAPSLPDTGMVDAMAMAAPGNLEMPAFDEGAAEEMPPLDFDAIEAGEALPELDGDFPAMDLGGLNMDDLDDMPETIE